MLRSWPELSERSSSLLASLYETAPRLRFSVTAMSYRVGSGGNVRESN